VETDDIVALLAGSRIPAILRQQEDKWLYVGPAKLYSGRDWLCSESGKVYGRNDKGAWSKGARVQEVKIYVLV